MGLTDGGEAARVVDGWESIHPPHGKRNQHIKKSGPQMDGDGSSKKSRAPAQEQLIQPKQETVSHFVGITL